MNLTKYNPTLPNHLFRFFDDQLTQADHRTAQARPAVNIAETDESFTIEVVAPGRKKDHFAVELNDELLTITYQAEEVETPKLLRREFTIGNFKRTFKLDGKVVKGEEISATYSDGILKLMLPKQEEAVAKGPQRIAVA